MRRQQQQMTQG
jgi:hypothetical protein